MLCLTHLPCSECSDDMVHFVLSRCKLKLNIRLSTDRQIDGQSYLMKCPRLLCKGYNNCVTSLNHYLLLPLQYMPDITNIICIQVSKTDNTTLCTSARLILRTMTGKVQHQVESILTNKHT